MEYNMKQTGQNYRKGKRWINRQLSWESSIESKLFGPVLDPIMSLGADEDAAGQNRQVELRYRCIRQ